ncbi:MAG: ATP-binding cassette domain-containing protein [Pseudomonadota bacterium]
MQHTDAAMADQKTIEAHDVWLALGSGASAVSILRGAGLTLENGQSAAVVGPSGSGKSTFLMVLGGLERPDKGSVKIAGTDITTLSQDDLTAFRGRSMGIVFQSFHLIPTMTALENVAVPLELAGAADAFDRAAAELNAVGLSGRHRHYPAQLSGGEQQRVAIARALAPRPALLLADEPTGNLDEKTGQDIADLIFDSTARRQQSLVLVTHDLSLASRCDRVLTVADGQLSQLNAEAAA